MGTPSVPDTVLLFIGALYREEKYFTAAKERLTGLFGDIALETPSIEWDFSGYYKKELGSPIMRRFLFFRDMICPDTLSDIKLLTNDLEQKLSVEGRRNINLDPGYLTPHNVVLASTKNYSHRIYIGKGIFAEVTLVFRDGRYQPHLFTYQDFASKECIGLFGRAREMLRPGRSV